MGNPCGEINQLCLHVLWIACNVMLMILSGVFGALTYTVMTGDPSLRMFYQPEMGEMLGELTQKAERDSIDINTVIEFDQLPDVVEATRYIFIMSCVVFAVGFYGVCIGCCKSRILITIYLIPSIIFVFGTLSAMILLVLYQAAAIEYLHSRWMESHNTTYAGGIEVHSPATMLDNYIMRKFECCGIDSALDLEISNIQKNPWPTGHQFHQIVCCKNERINVCMEDVEETRVHGLPQIAKDHHEHWNFHRPCWEVLTHTYRGPAELAGLIFLLTLFLLNTSLAFFACFFWPLRREKKQQRRRHY